VENVIELVEVSCCCCCEHPKKQDVHLREVLDSNFTIGRRV